MNTTKPCHGQGLLVSIRILFYLFSKADRQGVVMEQSNKKEQYSRILAEVQRVVKFTGTLQEHIHQRILIPTVLYSWNEKDSNIVSVVLNGLKEAKTLRVEAIQYWFSEMAGYKITYDEKKGYHANSNFKGVSSYDTKHVFNYDREHLDILRNKHYRFWKIAPIVIQILKAPDSLDKVFSPFEKKLAQLMLIGKFDEASITNEIDKILANSKRMMNDQKVREWASTYFDQHPEELAKKETKGDEESEEEVIKFDLPYDASPTDIALAIQLH